MRDDAAGPMRGPSAVRFTVGIDTGGTFIDVVVSDGSGMFSHSKTPSDSADLSGSVITGLGDAAEQLGLTREELLRRTRRIVHGSTVATNALLTRGGAASALLTTEGFRDILNMRRGVRERAMDSRYAPPPPLIPRQRIFTVPERIDCEGTVVRPLDEQALRQTLERVRATGVESVAICLLFSFLNPAHERRVAELARDALAGSHVSLSSEVLPQVRLYERMSTTAVNAVVSPLLARYLDELGAKLRVDGFDGHLLIMQSSGGVASPEVARRFGVGSVLSGPAAAPVAASQVAAAYNARQAISIDMGGTSFDVCLVTGGRPQVTSAGDLAGYRIATPMVALHTIGAGGGSIVELDARSLLTVGPQSAGAFPGPVCYRRGGTRPTVTDANLLLGYIDPDSFWGGRLRLDVDAAKRAFDDIGRRLGLDCYAAAFGAYQVANESMVDAIREVSVRQGHDPREFALVAVGGAGPLHAGALARELQMRLVIVPRLASVFCALGGILSDLRHEFVVSMVTELDRLRLRRANELLDGLRREARSTLALEGVEPADMLLQVSADLRYVGQFTEVEVALPGEAFTDESMAGLVDEFHRRHEAINGYRSGRHGLEMVNLRVVATGRIPKPPLPASGAEAAPFRPEPSGERRLYWSGAWERVPVYQGAALRPGATLPGPAIIDQGATTILLPPGLVSTTDRWGNCLLHEHGVALKDTVEWLARC